jgi:hypothetical protein
MEGLADAADLLAASSASSNPGFGPRSTVTEINRIARALVNAARATTEDAITADEITALGSQLADAASTLERSPVPELTNDLVYWCDTGGRSGCQDRRRRHGCPLTLCMVSRDE